jgi:tight adherence protein C
MLPDIYEGNPVTWCKKLDTTFLLMFAMTLMAVFFIKLGGKRDQENIKKERLELLEKEYAKLVSKFTMLLSAGLSIRNAWERIVLLYRRKGNTEDNLFRELNWGLLQMQKGVSELEVYEAVGARFGNIHYKKLMAMFISDRKRGSVNLLDAMNHEMLSAWEEQKRKSRQQGEKIGTKLLIPMMGMLGIVFVIVMMPALLSFGN